MNFCHITPILSDYGLVQGWNSPFQIFRVKIPSWKSLFQIFRDKCFSSTSRYHYPFLQ